MQRFIRLEIEEIKFVFCVCGFSLSLLALLKDSSFFQHLVSGGQPDTLDRSSVSQHKENENI